MNELTPSILTRAESWLCLTALLYCVMNGAQIFETFLIIPKWSTAPPESLQYINGQFLPNLKTFWIVLHSLHEICFIVAIVFCWKLDLRNSLLILFAVHFAVRTWTILYFAPNLMAFQSYASGEGNIANIIEKISLWRKLNYVRVGIFIALNIALIPIIIKLLHLKIKG